MKSLMNKKGKDVWDIVQIGSTFINLILLGTITIILNSQGKNRELEATYVKCAIDIIQNKDTSVTNLELRKWAVNILDEKSPVSMPPKLKAILLGRKVKDESDHVIFVIGGDRGFLKVNTYPEDYLYVLIDDIPFAITPTRLNLCTGKHLVEIQTDTGKTIADTVVFLNTWPELVLTLDLYRKTFIMIRDSSTIPFHEGFKGMIMDSFKTYLKMTWDSVKKAWHIGELSNLEN